MWCICMGCYIALDPATATAELTAQLGKLLAQPAVLLLVTGTQIAHPLVAMGLLALGVVYGGVALGGDGRQLRA